MIHNFRAMTSIANSPALRLFTPTHINCRTAYNKRKIEDENENENEICTKKIKKQLTGGIKTPYFRTKYLSSESTYPQWLQYIESSVRPYADYLVFDLSIEGELYEKKLYTANTLCAHNLIANSNINQIFYQSIDSRLSKYLNSYLASENFENIKKYFQSKITANYFLSLESGLQLNLKDSRQFLIDLELLSNIYFLVFKKAANDSLKIQWIMDAIYKNPLANKLFILEINSNWSVAYNNVSMIQDILESC